MYTNMNVNLALTLDTKISSKWTTGINTNQKTVSLLEDKIEENIDYHRQGVDFLDTPNT